MSRMRLLREFWTFIWQEKMWWIVPFVIVLLLVGLLAIVGSSPIGPAVYALF